jgi:flagellar basal body-associated protein FliL
MARPTKPKDLKPKADAEVASVPAPPPGGGAAFDLKYIVMLVIVVLASLLGSAGSTYLMTTMVVIPELSRLSAAPAEDAESGGHGEAASENQVGMNLELDEFTVNLKADAEVKGSQFLRAKMALSIKVPEAENCYAQHHAALPGQVVAVVNALPGGKVAGAAAPVDRTLVASGGESGPSCEDIFKNNMAKYVPTARDVINAALMKRTAGQLASLEGQEALKDEIKEQLTAIMAPNYEVLRVNFQDFIIQR